MQFSRTFPSTNDHAPCSQARLTVLPVFFFPSGPQLVRQHIRGGALERSGIKAIYVAPMKALAQEVVSKFSQRLKPLGLVRERGGGERFISLGL